MTRMTCCSAIACSCSISPRGRRSNACRVFGVHRSTYYRWKHQVDRPGWRCSARASGAGRRCPTNCRRSSRSGSSRSRSGTRVSVRAASRRCLPAPSGAPWSLSPTASTRRCAATALKPAPSAWRWSPATARPTSRRANPSQSRTSPPPARRAGRDRLLLRRPTARHPRRGLAAHRDRHLQLYAWAELVRCARAGPDWRQTSRFASRVAPTCATPAGGSTACSPTTATSSAPRFAPRSTRSAPATAASAPADPRPTATSNDCTAPSSKVLAPRLRALPATSLPRSQRELDAYLHNYNFHRAHTGRNTQAEPPPNSFTVPQRWSPDEPNLSAHPESVQPKRLQGGGREAPTPLPERPVWPGDGGL